jgi:hypothetical protein
LVSFVILFVQTEIALVGRLVFFQTDAVKFCAFVSMEPSWAG